MNRIFGSEWWYQKPINVVRFSKAKAAASPVSAINVYVLMRFLSRNRTNPKIKKLISVKRACSIENKYPGHNINMTIKISREELSGFRDKGRRLLKEDKFGVGSNPARQWRIYKHPLIQAKNYFIVSFCKLLPPCELKNSLYRMIGVRIGKNVSIANDAILDTIFPELIRIDDNVIIGWGTKLYTHEFSLDGVRIGTVHIGKNSMVGEWSVVRPGVRIGRKSMVAAMSFVNEDVPENTVEGGVPIHVIRHVERVRKKEKEAFVS
jgi:acetyltransferase-like isoleucine patch superfamily enzyme